MTTHSSPYRFLTSIRLSVVLLLLLTADLAIGYICLHYNASLFEPMNVIGLKEWLLTYGPADLSISAWFFFLLILLFCLVVNTLFCTYDKLHHLFSTLRTKSTTKRFWLTLFIHLMHLAIVCLFLGYFISYTMSTIDNSITLTPGSQKISFGKNYTVSLHKMIMQPYPGHAIPGFKGRFIDTHAHLVFSDNRCEKRVVLSMNNPVFFHGYSIFLQRFNPKRKNGMASSRYIVMDIRHDPGVNLTFFGMFLFIAGLVGYTILRGRVRKQARSLP